MNKGDLLKRQIQEFIRLKELNLELLDVLSVTIKWFIAFHKKTQIEIPNIKALSSLVSKAYILLHEIDSPPFLQLSDDFLQRKKSDKDLTEPLSFSSARSTTINL